MADTILHDHRRFFVRALQGRERTVAARTFRLAVRPAGAVWAGAMTLRRALWRTLLRPTRLPAPVASVGNLTAGGTGKTPFVEWLAGWLLAEGRAPAVLSRGYRAGPGAPGGLNDEQRALAANLPGVRQYAHADRRVAGRRAIADGANCLILDDGFQHLRLHRDVNIVLLDARDPLGGGAVLPAGLMREPRSALRAADALVLTHVNARPTHEREALRAQAKAWAPRALWAEAAHEVFALQAPDGARESAHAFEGARAALFCGLGNPSGFLATARTIGLNVVEAHYFPDHFAYPEADLARLIEAVRASGADLVLTTQKDAVKIAGRWSGPAPLRWTRARWILTTGAEALQSLLRDRLGV